jgi:hypothetical protein
MALLPQAGQLNNLVDKTCTSVIWRGSSKTTPQLGHLARNGFMGIDPPQSVAEYFKCSSPPMGCDNDPLYSRCKSLS